MLPIRCAALLMDLLEHHVCLLELCLFVSSRALFVTEVVPQTHVSFNDVYSMLSGPYCPTAGYEN